MNNITNTLDKIKNFAAYMWTILVVALCGLVLVIFWAAAKIILVAYTFFSTAFKEPVIL